jgi:SH3-like domain-containing protein
MLERSPDSHAIALIGGRYELLRERVREGESVRWEAFDTRLDRAVVIDGRGVALRSSPGGDRLPGKGYDEGATVTAFERSGEWTHIRGGDGREGWVLSVTLAP